MIIFTDHALIRMKERGVSRTQVMAAIRNPEEVVEEEDGAKIFRKRFGNATLAVIAEIKKRKTVLITLYWI